MTVLARKRSNALKRTVENVTVRSRSRFKIERSTLESTYEDSNPINRISIYKLNYFDL